jgi:hypothetical protein
MLNNPSPTRYASLARRNPGFALIAVVSLAIGTASTGDVQPR